VSQSGEGTLLVAHDLDRCICGEHGDGFRASVNPDHELEREDIVGPPFGRHQFEAACADAHRELVQDACGAADGAGALAAHQPAAKFGGAADYGRPREAKSDDRVRQGELERRWCRGERPFRGFAVGRGQAAVESAGGHRPVPRLERLPTAAFLQSSLRVVQVPAGGEHEGDTGVRARVGDQALAVSLKYGHWGGCDIQLSGDDLLRGVPLGELCDELGVEVARAANLRAVAVNEHLAAEVAYIYSPARLAVVEQCQSDLIDVGWELVRRAQLRGEFDDRALATLGVDVPLPAR
jgi:hypothetical protein